MSDSSEDRELMARLQAADPAQRTPVPPKHWISDLTEATMNDNTNTDETRSGQGRRRTWVLVAAAAVVVGALGVGSVAALNSGDDAPPAAATAPERHRDRGASGGRYHVHDPGCQDAHRRR